MNSSMPLTVCTSALEISTKCTTVLLLQMAALTCAQSAGHGWHVNNVQGRRPRVRCLPYGARVLVLRKMSAPAPAAADWRLLLATQTEARRQQHVLIINLQ